MQWGVESNMNAVKGAKESLKLSASLSFSHVFLLALPLSLSLKQRGNIQCRWEDTRTKHHTHTHTLILYVHTNTDTYTHKFLCRVQYAARHILYYINKLPEDTPTQAHVLSFFVFLFYFICLDSIFSVSLSDCLFPLCFIFSWIFTQNEPFLLQIWFIYGSLCTFIPPAWLLSFCTDPFFFMSVKNPPGRSSKQITHVQHILLIAIFLFYCLYPVVQTTHR